MTNKQKVKSKHSNQYWMIFGTLFFGSLSVLSSKGIFNNIYIDLIGLIVFLGLLGFSLVCLNCWVNKTEIELYKKIIISKNKLITKEFKDIKGFKEKTYEGKYQNSKRLIFKTEKGFLVIDSNSYQNYIELARFAKKNFKHLSKKELKAYEFQQTLFLRFFFLFASFLFLGIFLDAQFENADDLEKDLAKTQITLSAQPKIESTGGKNSRDYIRIFTEEYQEFKFSIGGDRYKSCNNSILNELEKGDEVEINLHKNVLHSKILKTKEPSFMTKYFNWDEIEIYQFKLKDKEYINLDELKTLMKEDKFWSWGFLLFGILSIYMVLRKY